MRRCPNCGSFYPSQGRCPRDGAQLEVTDCVVDRYLVVDRVGEGGMGSVYKAHHTLLDNRVVAIKMLHRQLSQNPEVVNRFFREAKAASQVDNEHIIDVVDFGVTSEGDSFLVMEFLQGENLRDVVDEQGALPLERAFSIGMQIAEALYATHRKGIIHRDLKPENVLLLSREEGEFVKLLDFGIAKLTELRDTRLTRAGMVVGTPSYMSPEQAGAEQVDHRTDIYALGVILYEMLTGSCPFEGESTKDVLVSQLTRQPVPPRQLRPEIPRSVEKVLMRALRKDRDERPQTMIHLAYELRDALLQREAEVSGAAPVLDQEVAEQDELPIGTMEVDLPPSSARRLLPFIGLGAGLLLGVVVTVLLMRSDGVKPKTKVVKEVVFLHAEAGPVPAARDAGPRFKPMKIKRSARRRPAGRRPRHSPVKSKPKPKPKPEPVAEPTGKWVATVVSSPINADVFERDRRLGNTPLKVDTTKGRSLTVQRLGYQPATVLVPKHATRTFSAKLKKSSMSWEVLSLSQLKYMMEKGQISRFTYRRRRDQLIKIRDQKIVKVRVKYKMGHISKEQYERVVQAIKDSYK